MNFITTGYKELFRSKNNFIAIFLLTCLPNIIMIFSKLNIFELGKKGYMVYSSTLNLSATIALLPFFGFLLVLMHKVITGNDVDDGLAGTMTKLISWFKKGFCYSAVRVSYILAILAFFALIVFGLQLDSWIEFDDLITRYMYYQPEFLRGALTAFIAFLVYIYFTSLFVVFYAKDFTLKSAFNIKAISELFFKRFFLYTLASIILFASYILVYYITEIPAQIALFGFKKLPSTYGYLILTAKTFLQYFLFSILAVIYNLQLAGMYKNFQQNR